MVLETKRYDVGDYLRSDDEIASYLQGCYDTGESDVFLVVLRDVAKINGISALAKQTGLSRESLYKALNGKRQPRFDTLQKILTALEIKVRFAA